MKSSKKPSPSRGGLKNDAFVDKSLITFISVLSIIRAQDRQDSWIDRVNAFYKLCCSLFLIVLVALSRSPYFVFAVISVHLLAVALLKTASMKRVLALAATAFGFSCLMIAPAFFMGKAGFASLIPVKALASALIAGMLSLVKFQELTSALKRLHAPDFLLMVLDLSIRSLVMLGEFSLETLQALKMRRLGGRGGGYRSLAGVGGTVFLKSKEMSEEMHQAMVCRGFAGTYRPMGKLGFGLANAGWVLATAGLAALFFFT
ncbi:MAG: energy-coupling factor transporter transmembrane protein EcfT [Clostridiales bacterium]|jgi:cobalt/nickel transport system permease protein|nr:energy-coupling factor transporter transmembrane protein EcfT [Clostridiales bacterium]